MYKTTSDKLDRIARVSSHATKGSPTGRVDDLPPDVQEAENYYASLRDQWEKIQDELHTLSNEVHDLKQRLRSTLPHQEFRRVRDTLDRKAERLVMLQRESGDMRAMARAASHESWGALWMFCAQKVLDHKTFMRIDDEVAAWMARPHQEIGKGSGEESAHQRTRNNRAGKLRKRREMSRDHRSVQRLKLVYEA